MGRGATPGSLPVAGAVSVSAVGLGRDLTGSGGLGKLSPQSQEPIMITLTENAAKHIGTLQKEQNAAGKPLRVSVEAGGCSGMEYGMAFDEQKDGDELVSQDGVAVVIDPLSANFLKGSVIDYVDSLQGSGFKIQNPNVHSSCGCGKSFN
jgi:iron-sulfur cluster assembly accessory protein